MTWFEASVVSGAAISAERGLVWNALTDPSLLPQLTPLLTRIDADGDVWRWHLARIAALGVSVAPSFTEQMTFVDGRRISYEHAPPPGVHERAGAVGEYLMSDVPGGTRLHIALTLRVELPLPRGSRPAVRRIMTAVMDRTGAAFSRNLLQHLDAREL